MESGRPHDRRGFEGSSVGETDCPTFCGDGTPEQGHAPVCELAEAGSDKQVASLGAAPPAVEGRGDEAEVVAPPVQSLAEDAARHAGDPRAGEPPD